ncbi:thrombospondin type 3 repeat-containing protein [Desulfobulbus sp. F4]|nr:thrombospondin type 3 repeat-containing protein [Desulfobulbus sp. F4]
MEMDITLAAALPEITSTITIEGSGHFISGNFSVGTVLKITVSGNMTLNSSTIKDGTGGGIENDGTLILNNSTISGNSRICGGGGILNQGTATLNSSTVSGNRVTMMCGSGGEGSGNAASSGAGIRNSGTITLQNSIVSGNRFGELASLDSGIIIADSYNVFGHGDESNVNAFYGFTPGSKDITATSDGTKPTALASILSPLAANGVHALVAGSPAIDADMTCSTNLATDQQGHARPVGSGCDAGAIEYNPSNTDSDSDGLADASDNCPLIANSDQKDTDKDDFGDACDPNDDRANMSPIYKLLLRN